MRTPLKSSPCDSLELSSALPRAPFSSMRPSTTIWRGIDSWTQSSWIDSSPPSMWTTWCRDPRIWYTKSKLRLASAGFKFRKFATNSEDLRRRIRESESSSSEAGGADKKSHHDEDQSYAESSLEVKTEDESGTNKVLGVQWNANRDKLQFNIGDVISTMDEMEPTKRDVASATARFFDPLGVVSPVAISFKMFCQQLLDWLGRPSDRKSAREVETAPLNDEGI